MVEKAKNRLTMTFFHGETTRETLGIDRYALPYWVASHPTVEPCDVVSSSTDNNADAAKQSHNNNHGHGLLFWTPKKLLSSTNIASPSKLHLLRRRRQCQESSKHNATLDAMIKNDVGLRTREWCFFAGHVLRWGEIYNDTTPSDTNWIWNYQGTLPDAQEWLTAIHQYGYNGAVDFMTRPFANTKV